MKLLLSFTLVAFASAALELVADAPEPWLQVCCQDNDKNDDGGISFREFTPFVLDILDVNRKEMEKIFLAADVDRNSDLDGTECPIVRQQLREKMKEKVQLYLKNYDVNGDKKLDKEEVVRLGEKEFKVTANESDHIYYIIDNSRPISGEKLTDLLLELRAAQIRLAGHKMTCKLRHFWAWDGNSNGVISYEEARRGVGKEVPPLTFKQAFKRSDFDKDLHISPAEYLALVDELERGNVEVKVSRRRRSDDIEPLASAEDEFLSKNSRFLPKTDLHFERSFSRDSEAFSAGLNIGADEHKVKPRKAETGETAPPLTFDVNKEIDDKQAALISSRKQFNMGGGRGPSFPEMITVDPNDPDFQRF